MGGQPKTAEGSGLIEYRFVRMARGLWDSAFLASGDHPVAFPLHVNVFGEEPYIGADELDAAPNQKMQDAYDALIFLGPIDKMHQSAFIDLYTPEFRRELKRRFGVVYTESELRDMFKRTKTKNLDDFFSFVEKTPFARPVLPLPEAQLVGPIDEWKTKPER